METIDVHAALLSLAERERVVLPPLWFHDLKNGSVTYKFAGSENTFSWGAEAIASMPVEAVNVPLTERAQKLVGRWKHEVASTGSTRPDRVVVNHDTDRMTLVWTDPDRTQTIEGI